MKSNGSMRTAPNVLSAAARCAPSNSPKRPGMYSDLSEAEIAARLELAKHQSFHEKPFPQFAERPARAAAVLLPLTRMGNEWYVLYTRRTDIVEHHKGQVSFPGGAA